MKLNRKLSQQSWQEVNHFVLDDCLGCCLPVWYCPFITSTSIASFFPFNSQF